MFEITTLAGGASIGIALAWILENWVRIFLKQLADDNPEQFVQSAAETASKNIYRWLSYLGMMFVTAILSGWRDWSPELVNDLILISALVGIGWIDSKSMLIEGRLVALALALRLAWLSFFAPHEILNSLTGLLVGAGLLYFIGFLYETFRHRQGLGEGDAAVLGLIGLWVGWQGLGAVLLLAALSGIIIGGFSLLRKKPANQNIPELLQTQIPFAPFLCLGGVTVYLLQQTGYIQSGLGF
ncbi:MAG: prepilin peptidase [SAR324 cluster bacterium]|nr:prepilin peptidase [SAR324 cluster bacterium]MBL7036169.1 prepilin peptidase [SAR324 cluster bacterium]